ncbi:hypothetical protein Tco_0929801 [Tanacetum coccineum]
MAMRAAVGQGGRGGVGALAEARGGGRGRGGGRVGERTPARFGISKSPGGRGRRLPGLAGEAAGWLARRRERGPGRGTRPAVAGGGGRWEADGGHGRGMAKGGGWARGGGGWCGGPGRGARLGGYGGGMGMGRAQTAGAGAGGGKGGAGAGLAMAGGAGAALRRPGRRAGAT